MALKIKIKATGREATKMAKNAKVEQAFHEVFHKIPKTVKATGKTGEPKRKMMVAVALSKARQAGAKIPDKSGANFVSRQDLNVYPGEHDLGWKHGKERLPDKPEPSEGVTDDNGLLGTTANLGTGHGLCDGKSAKGINPETIGDRSREVNPAAGWGPSHDGGEMNPLRQVNRVLNPIELVRMKNNSVRDMRTALGRGKTGVPVAEEENNVITTR